MLIAALVFGIATTCQVVAPKLRVPALVLLLPAGFVLGLVAPQYRLDQVLGPVFPVAVDLIVAVILFQGGMGLSAIPLKGKDRRVVRNLLWFGAPITGLAATAAAHYILGMEWPMAFMLGAIIIVSGPTVVTPILDFAQPNARVRGILIWEGTILDPVGALIAVVVFSIIKASNTTSLADGVLIFIGGLVVAVVAAAIGTLLFTVGGLLVRGNRVLATEVLLGSVIVTAGLANAVSDDSGLLAALLMGIAAPRVAKKFGASLDNGTPFFDTIVSIGIGVLFISIAALVPSATVMTVLWPTVAITAILMFVVRPIVAAICTAGAGLVRNERIFIGWMDPRGIVAAATASSVGAVLVSLNIPDAGELLPAAFIIIAVTVVIYSLTATPVVRLLRVQAATPTTLAE